MSKRAERLTVEQATAELKRMHGENWDPEQVHGRADDILLAVIRAYSTRNVQLVRAYNALERWYA